MSVRLRTPGVIAETVLPSIVSSQLSYVSLHVEDHPEDEEWDGEIDYLAWAAVEGHLCRLAKLFGVKNTGKRMLMVISGDYEPGPQADRFLECVRCEEFLPKLKEEVELFVSDAPWTE